MRLLYIFVLLSIHYLSYSQCDAGLTVMSSGSDYQFNNVSTVADGDMIISQAWKFGDGSTSLETNPTYNYTLAGLYNVKLEIATQDGCNDSDSMIVEVCELSLDFNLSSVCDNEGNVSLILEVDDVFNVLEEVNVYLDDIPVSDTAIIINGSLNLDLLIPGDGNQHFVRVESLPNGFCSETIGLLVQDCNSSCFLSNLSIDDGYNETHNIALLENQFSPNNRVIELGDRVRFIWTDDNHSSTSVDSVSIDKWDSGIQDSSYVFEITPKNPGLKQYYSTPDGDPEGDYSGNIIANCPDSRGNILEITFINAAVPPSGFYIGIDGVIIRDTTYEYNDIGLTTVEYFLAGDGKNHQISIIDAEDESCTLKQTVKAINCQGNFDCSVNVTAGITDRCDPDSLVTIGVSISSLSPTENGVLIMLDDTLVMDTIYFDNAQASTSLSIYGDGLIHAIKAIDLTDTFCMDEVFIKINDCSASCSIDNLEIGTGSNNTVVLGVTNESISLKDIVISSGDDILWQWFQDSLVGIRSYEESGPNSWDSGLQTNGAIFISPTLTAGIHPYFMYDAAGDTIYQASIQVVASCEENMIPVFYNFLDTNGSQDGYDIYIDSVRLESGPFHYALDGNNRGVFQLEGDDQEHLIEIRDLSESACISGAIFLAPTCEVSPCGGMIELQVQDSCYNDNTMRYLVTVSHPDPSEQGFILRLNGQLYEGFPFFYGPNGETSFEGILAADSSEYIFTYEDLEDQDCIDTLRYQSPKCNTECALTYISADVIDDSYIDSYPGTPDSLVGCQDSFVYVSVKFSEVYTDAIDYTVSIDGQLIDDQFFYEFGDTINTAIFKVIGDEETHVIVIQDKIDTSCRLTTEIFTPRCFSPCNIDISEVVLDSCFNEIAYYSLILDTLTNRIDFQAYYDGDSLNTSVDSLTAQFQAPADGLSHKILLIDNPEPLCRDSFDFIGGYCLDCPLDVTLVQIDSCEIGDSIGYIFEFNQELDSTDVSIEIGDSTFTINPKELDFKYQLRLRGDSSAYTYVFTSLEDRFCTDTVFIQTIDCTPIICDPDFIYSIDGLTITFSDSSETSEPIIDQSWSINDVIEIGNLSTFNFTVDSIGMYEVCHKIATDSCSSEICKDVLVGDPCTLITPLFSVAQITDGYQFTNLSTGNIDDYQYRFGDGIFSSNPNAFHIYAESGSYEACLIVRQEEFECELEYCETIDVLLSDVDINAKLQLDVYPNPLSSGNTSLNINYQSDQRLDLDMISFINYVGEKVTVQELIKKDKTNYSLEFKDGLTSGVYFLLIEHNGVVSRKVVVF